MELPLRLNGFVLGRRGFTFNPATQLVPAYYPVHLGRGRCFDFILLRVHNFAESVLKISFSCAYVVTSKHY